MLAFRHASTSCVIRRPSASSGHQLLNRHDSFRKSMQPTVQSSLPSFYTSKYDPITTTRLYHSTADDAVNNANGNGATSNSATAISNNAPSDSDDEDGAQKDNGGGSRAKRNQIKKKEKQQISDGDGGLSWETFDFGDSPKMDKRFKDNSPTSIENTIGIPEQKLNTISTDSLTYKSYLASESNLDKQTSNQSLKTHAEIAALDPELVTKSIEILRPFIQDKRLQRIDQVLHQRTRHTRFLFENPSNPSNVWACLRTLDSFGIQYVDVIVNSESYLGKAAVNQKRGMRTAMGSAMWMTIRQFGSIEEAIKHLREEEGCLIYASDLNPTAKDVRDLTWDIDFDEKAVGVDGSDNGDDDGDNSKDQRPICIVMGNEDQGISDKMRELADETFYLPMCGFAESFNLSVATAITLAYMSAVSSRGDAAEDDGASVSGNNNSKGPLRPGDLDPHALQCLRLKGILNSLAQQRVGRALLKKEGIVLPEALYSKSPIM